MKSYASIFIMYNRCQKQSGIVILPKYATNYTIDDVKKKDLTFIFQMIFTFLL